MKKTTCFVSVILLFAIAVLTSSCGAYKQVRYFQDIDSLQKGETIYPNDYEFKMQTGDILYINVSSPTAVTEGGTGLEVFNQQSTTTSYAFNEITQGYLIDVNGEISYPILGKIKLEGLTRIEAQTYMESLLRKYINEPIVMIRYVNQQITILGETGPRRLTINNDRLSIVEAIASAGDLGIQGKRKNVLIIRNNNGVLEQGRVDFTSKSIFHSPYYWLRPNDIVYVEPAPAKLWSASFGTYGSIAMTLLSWIVTIIALTK